MDLFEDIARFTVHLKNEEIRTTSAIYLNYGFCSSLISPFMFRLLRARPASEDTGITATYQEATRLALLLFLSDIKCRFSNRPVACKVHVQKLVSVLVHNQHGWEALETLKLSVIAMAILNATNETQIRFLQSEWMKAVGKEGIAGSSHAESVLKGIIWTESIQGRRYREVHERFWGSDTPDKSWS